MSPLRSFDRTLARARARKRQREGGAVIFILAMTLAILISMGSFAMRAASSEIRTSGFLRQATQTQYLAEYGVLGAANEVQGAKAQLYVQLMLDPVRRDHLPDPTDPRNVSAGRVGIRCPSISAVPEGASELSLACRRIPSAEFAQSWTALSTAVTTPRQALVQYDVTNPRVPGSLGAAAVVGNFTVELTDPGNAASPPGFDTRLGLCFTEVTATATGLTFPQLGAGKDLAIYTGQTVASSRARLVVGPIRCPK
jgi:hypothetical protein